MAIGRYGVVAFGACAALTIGAGAACSHSYSAEDAPADAAALEASLTDAPADAPIDAATADSSVTPVPTFVELASGLGTFGGIAANDKDVYFTVPSTGRVKTVPI